MAFACTYSQEAQKCRYYGYFLNILSTVNEFTMCITGSMSKNFWEK